MPRLLVFASLVVALACTPVTRETGTTPVPAPRSGGPATPAATAPAGLTALPVPSTNTGPLPRVSEFAVGTGQGPHDVAPAADGGVWYTAQRTGELGHLDPKTGAWRVVKLGAGSAPHGVIVGPDGTPWITDSGLNAIVRVDPKTNEITRFPLPGPNVNLNTAVFDRFGDLWFTGQSGYYGRVAVRGNGQVTVYNALGGPGPYGIASAPRGNGNIYYVSLAGSHVAVVDVKDGTAQRIDPPTKGQGARRIWEDSKGDLWISEWNAGQVGRYTPSTKQWKEWKLPGTNPMAYAVYVDDADIVWITDWGANAIVRFDPATETFTSLPHSAPNAAVRQLLGRPGEVWGAASGQDKLLVIRTR